MSLLCPRIKSCRNSIFCNLCVEYSKYLPAKSYPKKSRLGHKSKPGLDFEEEVAKLYNKIASRRPGSGSFWHLPGDVITPEILMEVKERGTKTSRGEKTISIHKDWLSKIESEARALGRKLWCLPFRYKGDDRTYAVIDFEDFVVLITEILTSGVDNNAEKRDV